MGCKNCAWPVDIKINRPDWMVKIWASCEAEKTQIGWNFAVVLSNLHSLDSGKVYFFKCDLGYKTKKFQVGNPSTDHTMLSLPIYLV